MVKLFIKGIGLLVSGLLFSLLFALLAGWIFMLLWNSCVVPAVTVAQPIGFWVAVGLTFICTFLSSSSKSS